MREVQRLADRIVLHWIQLDGITYHEWIRLPMESDERKKRVLDYRRVDAVPADINPDNLSSLDKYKPLGIGWWWKGAEGWPGKGLAMTFDTPSKNLERGDVWVGEDEVRWKDDADVEEQYAPRASVDIPRDSRTGEVIRVQRR